uniref:Uncharacterized protein n=1 Tax=Heterorhabditis bacteriophora TaxID=37862 RepID=A0A1I7WY95_HETBA
MPQDPIVLLTSKRVSDIVFKYIN